MQRTIVFGSAFIVFFMLIVPSINAIEYHRIATNIKEQINLLSEPIGEHHPSYLISLAHIKEIKDIIDKKSSNPNRICLSCLDDIWNPRCLILFCKYILLIPIIFILQTVPFFKLQLFIIMEMADAIHNQAKEIGCLWTFS